MAGAKQMQNSPRISDNAPSDAPSRIEKIWKRLEMVRADPAAYDMHLRALERFHMLFLSHQKFEGPAGIKMARLQDERPFKGTSAEASMEKYHILLEQYENAKSAMRPCFAKVVDAVLIREKGLEAAGKLITRQTSAHAAITIAAQYLVEGAVDLAAHFSLPKKRS